jgi:hypothetical protein
MLSARFAKWKWFDIVAFLFIVIVVCAAIELIAPGSGLAKAIHTGFHFFAIVLEWIAGGLTALATLLNQL